MLTGTLLVWCAAGCGVWLLLVRKEPRCGWGGALARAPLQIALWPLFVATLLPQAQAVRRPGSTAYDDRIDEVERTLGEALRALGRDLEDPLVLEWTRVGALGRAMRSAAARVEELDEVLGSPLHDRAALGAELTRAQAAPDGGAVVEVLQRRAAHLERLEAIRRQAAAELERSLAEATALASRLTLLRYEDGSRAGSAAGRARELTQTVEELCQVLAEARAA